VDRKISNASWIQMGGVAQNAALASECPRNGYSVGQRDFMPVRRSLGRILDPQRRPKGQGRGEILVGGREERFEREEGVAVRDRAGALGRSELPSTPHRGGKQPSEPSEAVRDNPPRGLEPLFLGNAGDLLEGDGGFPLQFEALDERGKRRRDG